MPSQPQTEKRNPRLLKRGDVVRVPTSFGDPSGTTEDVVRSVEVVLHLANGLSVGVPVDTDVDVVLDTDVAEELKSQIAAMQSEG